jgi:hypothetical protein
MPELTKAVNDLTGEMRRLESILGELDQRYRGLNSKFKWRTWIAAGTAVMVVLGFGATALVQQVLIGRNNTKICRLLDLQASDRPPPTTERGRYTTEQAKKIRTDAGCD